MTDDRLKVIVTGGAGFIGSHIVDRLIDDGCEVSVFDDQSADKETFYWNESPHAKKIRMSITADFLPVSPLTKDIDVLFHLAAETQIQPSIKDPVKTCNTNYMGTLNILECARKHNIKRVVLSSTSAIYGKHDPPHDEELCEDCLNPYSVTKYGAEQLCKMYHDLYGIETVILRYFNVYGDRMPTKGSYAPVIGIFLNQKSKGEPLTVVGDGTQRRDFVHVSDVVEANMLAMKTTNPESFGTPINIGTGKSYAIKDIANMIGGDIEYINERVGEIQESCANISKAKRLLNWQPKVNMESWLCKM